MSSRPDFNNRRVERQQALDAAPEAAALNLQKLAMPPASQGIVIRRIGPEHHRAGLNDDARSGSPVNPSSDHCRPRERNLDGMRRLLKPDENWGAHVGRSVELWRGGCFIRSGEVEDTTPDSTIMWLRFNGVDGRQLITKADEYDVYELE